MHEFAEIAEIGDFADFPNFAEIFDFAEIAEIAEFDEIWWNHDLHKIWWNAWNACFYENDELQLCFDEIVLCLALLWLNVNLEMWNAVTIKWMNIPQIQS